MHYNNRFLKKDRRFINSQKFRQNPTWIPRPFKGEDLFRTPKFRTNRHFRVYEYITNIVKVTLQVHSRG